jgi:hypothetical protein
MILTHVQGTCKCRHARHKGLELSARAFGNSQGPGTPGILMGHCPRDVILDVSPDQLQQREIVGATCAQVRGALSQPLCVWCACVVCVCWGGVTSCAV